jgi:hypothetical protein
MTDDRRQALLDAQPRAAISVAMGPGRATHGIALVLCPGFPTLRHHDRRPHTRQTARRYVTCYIRAALHVADWTRIAGLYHRVARGGRQREEVREVVHVDLKARDEHAARRAARYTVISKRCEE